ncbi:thermonuclease family protein [Prosthecomicrobium sp. N25]|uniref:thermonuclease family protein n=1 Tax=Prosthecomicrobium sp. N25 TaxID=3129254 RepID=UPI0030777C17
MTGHQAVEEWIARRRIAAASVREAATGPRRRVRTKTSAEWAALASKSAGTIGIGTRPVNRVLAAVLACLALPLTASGQERGAPAQPPVWVPVPTRIDRAAEPRERIQPDRPPPDDRQFFRVDAPARLLDPLTFEAEDQVFRLAGIVPVERSRVCQTREGARWACGLRASLALGRLVSGRIVGCRPIGAPPVSVLPPGSRTASTAIVAECTVDDRPLAQRLVADGWAVPVEPADPALAKAAAEAVARKRGIHAEFVPN